MRSFTSHLVLTSSALFLIGACEVTEPEPLVGRGPALPPIALVAIDSHQPGDTVVGMVTIRLPASRVRPGLVSYSIYLDSNVVTQGLGPTVSWSIDLHQVSEGPHLIQLSLYDSKPLQGMLGLIGAPNEILLFPIVVDHRDLYPPLPATNLNVSWTTYPTLTWSPTPDPRFTSYIVRRHTPSAYPPSVVVGSIFDRLTTTFVDTAGGLPVHGVTMSYSVEVSNGYLSVVTPQASTSYGTPFPLAGVDGVLRHPGSDNVLLFVGGEFVVFSTTSHAVVRRGPHGAGSFLSSNWVLTGDGSTIVQLALSGMDTLSQVNAYDFGTLGLVASWAPSSPLHPSLIAAPAGGKRIVTFGRSEALLLMDALTGAVVDAVPGAVDSVWVGRLFTSPDGSTAYVLAMGAGGFDTRIKRYTIASGTLVYQNDRYIPKHVVDVPFADDGNVMGLVFTSSGDEAVEIIDPVSLATVQTIVPPSPRTPGSLSYSTILTASSVTISDQESAGRYRILRIGLAGGQVEQVARLTSPARALVRAASGGLIYALPLDGTVPGWMVGM